MGGEVLGAPEAHHPNGLVGGPLTAWGGALKDFAEREVRGRLGAARWPRAVAAGRLTSFDTLLNDITRILPSGEDSAV